MEYQSKLETRNVGSLVSEIKDKDASINLNPLYQRDIVWDDEKKSKFINSVMLGIIPTNCVLNVHSDGKKTCVDGKQRMTSLLKFYNNEIFVEIDDVKYYS